MDYLINEYKIICSNEDKTAYKETKNEEYRLQLKEIEKILKQYINELKYTIKLFEEIEKG